MFSPFTPESWKLCSEPVHLPLERKEPWPIQVPGLARNVHVKIASARPEWTQAFALVAASYRARGYQRANGTALRFTPYHALPDTVTFVAKHGDTVIATLSLVF
jgi:hypothetical protein